MRGRWALLVPAASALACVLGEGPKDAQPQYVVRAYETEGDCPRDPELETLIWTAERVTDSQEDALFLPRLELQFFGRCAADGRDFACEPRGASVGDVRLHTTLSGEWLDGGEQIEASFDVVGTCGGACGTLDASTTFEVCHTTGALSLERVIDPVVKTPGRHPACVDLVGEDLGDPVNVYVFNNTDAALNLVHYDGSGAVVETDALSWGASIGKTAPLGHVFELAWSTGCAYRFKVSEPDQIEVFDGIQG